MIHTFDKHKFKSILSSKIGRNTLALLLLQGYQYVLPLITFPYLARVLGASAYGKIGFAAATIDYFAIVIGFGFALSATQRISTRHNDIIRRNEIICSTWSAQILLSALCLIGLIILIPIIPFFRENKLLIVLQFLTHVSALLAPYWLFQGLEKMALVAKMTVPSRLLGVGLTFALISKPEDYYLLPLCTIASNIVLGIQFIHYLYKETDFKWSFPSFGAMRTELNHSKEIFFTSVFINFYTSSPTVILGMFTSPQHTGLFVTADKILKMLKGFLGAFNQAYYPHISAKFSSDSSSAILSLKKFLLVYFIVSAIASTAIIIGAPLVIRVLAGDAYMDATNILRILALIPIFNVFTNVLGVHTLLALGHKKIFSAILTLSGAFSMLLSLLFVQKWGELGIASVMAATEAIICLAMYYFIKRKGIWR